MAIGSVTIYKGALKKLYADDFVLLRNRPVYRKVSEDTNKKGYFYKDKDNKNIKIDDGCILKTKEEAVKYCDEIVQKNMLKVMNALSGRVNDDEASKILNSIKKETECIYYEPEKLEYSYDMPKKEWKKLIKQVEEKNKNKK